jgi:rsbT co-antagonist protein RsbR
MPIAATPASPPSPSRYNQRFPKEPFDPMAQPGILTDVLQDETGILQRWTDIQLNAAGFRAARMSRTELLEQSRRFLSLLRQAVQSGTTDIHSPAWANTRQMLDELSGNRAQQGFSPSETAMFVFSLKEVLFDAMRPSAARDPAALVGAQRDTGALLDRLGLYTTEIYQRRREQVIVRQQQELLELSTPVVTLWQGVLALPIIGTLDSARTQVVMENLLQRVVDSGASIAIIDITGVPTVDTLTAQHLLKTVAAARLMGADCIISGIRPQIAQTIVHLGVDLGTVVTKATLADAFAVALRRLGLGVTKSHPSEKRRHESDEDDAPSAERNES